MPMFVETPSPQPSKAYNDDPFHLRRASMMALAFPAGNSAWSAGMTSETSSPLTPSAEWGPRSDPTAAVTRKQVPEVVSRERLQQICQPFFDQMLDAVLTSLRDGTDVHHGPDETREPQGCFGEAPVSTDSEVARMLPHSDGETAADSEVARTSAASTPPPPSATILDMLSGLELSRVQQLVVEPPSALVDQLVFETSSAGLAPLPQSSSSTPLDSRHAANGAASNSGGGVVVCCHWKNKGWCRFATSCKFAHPQHKRGVGVPPPQHQRGAGPTKQQPSGCEGGSGTALSSQGPLVHQQASSNPFFSQAGLGLPVVAYLSQPIQSMPSSWAPSSFAGCQAGGSVATSVIPVFHMPCTSAW